MTTFTLDRQQAQGFRNEGRIDPFTRQPFSEGQRVVACGHCAMVWLTDSWDANGRACACQETRTATRLPLPRQPAPPQPAAHRPAPSQPRSNQIPAQTRGFTVLGTRLGNVSPLPSPSLRPAPFPPPPRPRFASAPRLTWSEIFPWHWKRQTQAQLESLTERLHFLPNVGLIIGLFVGAFAQAPDLTLGGLIFGALMGLFAGFLAGAVLLGLAVLSRGLVAGGAQILRQAPQVLRRRLGLSPPRYRRLAIIAGAALGILLLIFVLS